MDPQLLAIEDRKAALPATRRTGGRPAPWRGQAFVGSGWVLYIGEGGVADCHAHHAIQFVWAVEEPMLLTVDGRSSSTTVALIPAGQSHSLLRAQGTVALLLVEPRGARGAALARAAEKQVGRDVDVDGVGTPHDRFKLADAVAWCDTFFARFGWQAEPTERTKPVEQAVGYVQNNLSGTPRLAGAAAAAHLSPSRLTHLFSLDMGIPFRRYVLWERVQWAVDEVRAGANLTEAAVRAGFSDSAHLSRVFRANFGMPPSLLLTGTTVVGRSWGAPTQPERSMQ